MTCLQVSPVGNLVLHEKVFSCVCHVLVIKKNSLHIYVNFSQNFDLSIFRSCDCKQSFNGVDKV